MGNLEKVKVKLWDQRTKEKLILGTTKDALRGREEGLRKSKGKTKNARGGTKIKRKKLEEGTASMGNGKPAGRRLTVARRRWRGQSGGR